MIVTLSGITGELPNTQNGDFGTTLIGCCVDSTIGLRVPPQLSCQGR